MRSIEKHIKKTLCTPRIERLHDFIDDEWKARETTELHKSLNMLTTEVWSRVMYVKLEHIDS